MSSGQFPIAVGFQPAPSLPPSQAGYSAGNYDRNAGGSRNLSVSRLDAAAERRGSRFRFPRCGRGLNERRPKIDRPSRECRHPRSDVRPSSQSTITAAFRQTGYRGYRETVVFSKETTRTRRLHAANQGNNTMIFQFATYDTRDWHFYCRTTSARTMSDKPTLARSRDPSDSRRASRLASFSLIRITRFTSYSIARAVDN